MGPLFNQSSQAQSGPPQPLQEDNLALDALLALNLGDFVSEAFIGPELAQRVEARSQSEPQKLRNQLQELIELYSLEHTLAVAGLKAAPDQPQGPTHQWLYDGMMAQLAQMLGATGGWLLELLQHPNGQQSLTLSGATHRQALPSPYLSWPLEQSGWQKVLNQTQALTVTAEKAPQAWPLWQAALPPGVTSLLACPMTDSTHGIGLLVFYKDPSDKQAPDWQPEQVALAQQAGGLVALAMGLERLLSQTRGVLENPSASGSRLLNLRAQLTEAIVDVSLQQQQFLEALAASIDARQDYTKGHSQGVAQTAQQLAEALNLNEKTVDLLYWAGLLGQVGQYNQPQAYEQSLNAQDKTALQQQLWQSSQGGGQLLLQLYTLGDVTPYVRYQKERWNGSGGPEGLSGQNIPLGARVLAVAQAYQALTEVRPYRQGGSEALSPQAALTQLKTEAGTLWDPLVVEALAKTVI